MAPISTSPGFSREEVGLALRNPGMPLEGLRCPITNLGDAPGPRGWTSWSSDREARPGEYELCIRATDATHKTQPLDGERAWNLGVYGINVVQRVPVQVT